MSHSISQLAGNIVAGIAILWNNGGETSAQLGKRGESFVSSLTLTAGSHLSHKHKHKRKHKHKKG